MKKSQAVELISRLKKAFPRPEVSLETVEIYCESIADLPFDATAETIARLISESKFFPSVAEIRTQATGPNLPEWDAAWDEVYGQISRVGRYREPKFSCPEVEQAMRCFGWQELCNLELDQVQTVRAQFRDAYRNIAQRSSSFANCGPREHWLKRSSDGELRPVGEAIAGYLAGLKEDGHGQS